MSEPDADFAVLGSTPLARLLAGLLADHGKRVIFVGESQSSYRLPRNIDLSVAPLTRPESWSLLGEQTAETLKVAGKIGGRRAWRRVHPIFFGEGQAAGEALSHILHLARGFGVAAELVQPSGLGPSRSGIVLRDAILLNRAVLEPALDQWLQQKGVQRLTPGKIEIASDGSALLRTDTSAVAARQAVLADDESIIAHLPVRQWPGLFFRQRTSTILTTPTRPLTAPVMLEIQTDSLLLQQPEGGVAATGSGDLAHFSAHLQRLLGRQRQVEQAGQTSFQTLRTADGAPAFGRAGGQGADVIAGTGPSGAFLVPALARWLCDKARPTEDAWFAARLVTRRTGNVVAEYAPQRAQATA